MGARTRNPDLDSTIGPAILREPYEISPDGLQVRQSSIARNLFMDPILTGACLSQENFHEVPGPFLGDSVLDTTPRPRVRHDRDELRELSHVSLVGIRLATACSTHHTSGS